MTDVADTTQLNSTALGVPSDAQDQWRALATALRERGPAACDGALDADAWWPAKLDDCSTALDLCRICPVRPECAAYAVAARERAGIWGGLSPEERAS
jgi:hypothetical protein